MRVLLVSGSAGARAWMRLALDPSSEFLEAEEGIAALEIARTGVNLVVADEITVPYGAFGLTRDLKILPQPPRVILLLDRMQDVWLARWAGADMWLIKPVDPLGLIAAARRPDDSTTPVHA